MKRRIYFGVFAVILVAVTFWLANHAYIEVSIEDGSDVTYTLTDQGRERTAVVKPKAQSFRKLVRKGRHEVFAERENKSSLNSVKVGGFLSTARVNVRLKSENERSFIGDNPNNCMYPISKQLLSMPCDDNFDQLKQHVSSTSDQATMVKKASGEASGLVEGVVYVKGGQAVMLVKEAEGHFAYNLGVDGSTSSRSKLEGFEDGQLSIVEYKEGFIVYGRNGSKAFIYSEVGAAPQGLTIVKPKSKNLSFYAIDTYKESIGFVYTSNPNIAGPSLDSPDGIRAHSEEFEEATGQEKKVTTEIIVQRSDGSRSLVFDTPAPGISVCGEDKVCTLKQGRLEIVQIRGSKKDVSYVLSGVTLTEKLGDQLLVVREKDIVMFNPLNGQGYVSYRLGDYSVCGLTSSSIFYTVCLATNTNKRVALQINPRVSDMDNIDKKIAALSGMPEIRTISAQNNFIHILPEVGEPEINPSTGYYEYNRTQIDETNAEINKKIDKLGIDRSKYTIIFSIR